MLLRFKNVSSITLTFPTSHCIPEGDINSNGDKGIDSGSGRRGSVNVRGDGAPAPSFSSAVAKVCPKGVLLCRLCIYIHFGFPVLCVCLQHGLQHGGVVPCAHSIPWDIIA